jgi:Fic/DOC family
MQAHSNPLLPCHVPPLAASSCTKTSTPWPPHTPSNIAQNQPFVDGNKRTGLAAALVFLDLNGVEVRDQEGRLYQAMLDIAERKLDKNGLAELLRELSH